MTNAHTGIGEAFRNVLRGIASVLTTGSWVVEDAADQARSTGMILDRIPEAAEHDAQRTLDHVNDGLTSWNVLVLKLEAAKRDVEKWQGRVNEAATKFKDCTDDAKRAELKTLGESAIVERKKAEAFRDQLQAAVDEAKPDADAALEAAEKAGFNREAALSQTEVLRIQDASAEATRNLALADQGGGISEASELLSEADRKVMEHVAAARAGKAVAGVMPKSADDLGAALDKVTRDGDAEAEFAALTAPTTAS